MEHDQIDCLHAAACELAESIADRLRRLEDERTLLPDADRLRAILAELGALYDAAH